MGDVIYKQLKTVDWGMTGFYCYFNEINSASSTINKKKIMECVKNDLKACNHPVNIPLSSRWRYITSDDTGDVYTVDGYSVDLTPLSRKYLIQILYSNDEGIRFSRSIDDFASKFEREFEVSYE